LGPPELTTQTASRLNFGSDSEHTPDTLRLPVGRNLTRYARSPAIVVWRHLRVVSAAILRLLGFAQNETTVYICGCTGTTVNVNLVHLHTHLLLAGNDTVQISMQCGGGIHSAECPLIVDRAFQSEFLLCLKPNSITLASSELAPNMFGASSELASVMEFGFYMIFTGALCQLLSRQKPCTSETTSVISYNSGKPVFAWTQHRTKNKPTASGKHSRISPT